MTSIGSEVFKNPTAKKVIFEIRFPNLFSMESKIGDIQLKIMEKFPKSSLFYQRNIAVVDMGPEVKLEDLEKMGSPELAKKIWQFTSEKEDYRLRISTDSLNIASESHKSYNNSSAPSRFREIIDYVLKGFFSVMNIPIILRLGFRYIDECPITEKTNTTFLSYYNSVFPLTRFKIDDAREMFFRTVVHRGELLIRYVEELRLVDNAPKLILDFDGFKENVNSSECLVVTDRLHDLIRQEFESSIKEPLLEYMRGK